jgi:hypothetical protein
MSFPRLSYTHISGLIRDSGLSKLWITLTHEEGVSLYEYEGLPECILEGFIKIRVWEKGKHILYFEQFIKDKFPNQLTFNPADQDVFNMCGQALDAVINHY